MRRGILVVLIAAAVALALGACSLLSPREAEGPALIENVRVKAEQVEVKRGTIAEELIGVGTLVSSRTEYQSFAIDGRLKEFAVKRGDRVRKGDVLLRLDAGGFDLQLAQQKLAVENRQAALGQLQPFVGDPDARRIDLLNLEIEQLKLNRLLEQQRKRVLVAAGDGVVTFLDDIRVGGPIESYRSVIGIARTDRLQLQFVCDLSAYGGDIKVGMPVTVAHEGAAVRGQVAVTPASAPPEDDPLRAELSGRRLLIDFVDALPEGWGLGDGVELRLELRRRPDVLLLPRRAVRQEPGRDFVWIADGDTRREVAVKVGLVTPTEAEIVSGLTEGQKVIVYP
ncbi:efflux RND transporter periplasmic adaptor subunit [Paenibacillus sp. HJGM_3]|uniref:efflux RND transporter periplasmic adaptor subunit n=1 Tax=Paenibacillus sp. HJGM_3 TaxID=3379816 RepID=UPI003859B0B6